MAHSSCVFHTAPFEKITTSEPVFKLLGLQLEMRPVCLISQENHLNLSIIKGGGHGCADGVLMGG